MSFQQWNSRQLITITAFVLAVVAGPPRDAFASVAYRVWFFDDVYETYEAGDITQGLSPLLNPPAWACGMWFDNPSYYRWVDGYGGTISSANLSQDVTVWITKGGCPDSFSIVKGNQVLMPPPGTSYMEITMPSGVGYGARWIDENGEWPFCDGCAVADELTSFPQDINRIDLTLSAYLTVSASVLQTRTQTTVAPTISALSGAVGAIRARISKGITARRQSPLGDHEPTVRRLEDATVRGLADAERQLDSCASFATQTRYDDAFIACTQSERSLQAAQSLLRSLQSTLNPPPR